MPTGPKDTLWNTSTSEPITTESTSTSEVNDCRIDYHRKVASFISIKNSNDVNKHFEKEKCSSPLEHWNYLGVDENLGPVAVSLRREKLDEHKDHGQQYNYRVIFRTSEVR